MPTNVVILSLAVMVKSWLASADLVHPSSRLPLYDATSDVQSSGMTIAPGQGKSLASSLMHLG